MASRSTRRKRRFARRKHHAQASSGRNVGGHASDPPRFGLETKSRAQLISFCDRLGFEPEPWQIDKLMEMIKNGDTTRDEVVEGLVEERKRLIHGDYVEIEVPADMPQAADEMLAELGDAAMKKAIDATAKAQATGIVDLSDVISNDNFVKLDALKTGVAVTKNLSVDAFDIDKIQELLSGSPVIASTTEPGTYTLTVGNMTTDPIPGTATAAEAQEIAARAGIDVATFHEANSSPHQPRLHRDEIELMAVDHHDEAYANRPTEEQWAELVATAKRRKRGIGRFAESQGFTLLSDAHDPRERMSWVKA